MLHTENSYHCNATNILLYISLLVKEVERTHVDIICGIYTEMEHSPPELKQMTM